MNGLLDEANILILFKWINKNNANGTTQKHLSKCVLLFLVYLYQLLCVVGIGIDKSPVWRGFEQPDELWVCILWKVRYLLQIRKKNEKIDHGMKDPPSPSRSIAQASVSSKLPSVMQQEPIQDSSHIFRNILPPLSTSSKQRVQYHPGNDR